MSDIQIFKYQSNEVRTIDMNGEPWFVLKDVCNVLGLSEPHRVANRLDEDERTSSTVIDSMGRQQETTVINESGLYNVILRSDKPEAKPFKKWVTAEVLPSIRKTGSYIAKPMSRSELMAQALIAAHEELEQKDKQIELLTADTERMKPKEIFSDAVSTSQNSILVGELAKLLKQNGIDIGEKRLYAWMRENGYLIKRKGADWNKPTQRSMELKLFTIKETVICHSDGHTSVNTTTKVTGIGQVYFVNLFLRKRNMEEKKLDCKEASVRG